MKTYFWIILFPFVLFVPIMYTLLEQNELLDIMILLETIYHGLSLIFNAIFVVVTIRTWTIVHDKLYIRGELILQTGVLLMSYFIYASIYFCDAMLDGGKEQYDAVFYFAYFAEHSTGCFLSSFIGTQYLPFKMWQNNETTIGNSAIDTRTIPKPVPEQTNEATEDIGLHLMVTERRRPARRPGDDMVKTKQSQDQESINIDPAHVHFQSVITMGDGLQAFMDYLATTNEQNYLIVK